MRRTNRPNTRFSSEQYPSSAISFGRCPDCCSMASTIGSSCRLVRRFRHRLPGDQQHLRFYRCLRIVALHKPVGTVYNARLRVGEVVLILVLRLSLLGLSGAFALGRCFFPCSLLDHLLGPLDLGQPRFPPPQLLRQLVAPLAAVSTVFFLIGCLGLLQQLLHLFLQLLLLFLHPPVAHRLVLAGVSFHLRPVQCHPPHFHCAYFQRHLQDLLEQSL